MLSTKVEDLSKQLFEKLAGYEDRYMPAAKYEKGNDFDVEFNKAITKSLGNTQEYTFRGTSAKFVPIRLDKSSHERLRQIKIVMLDPTSDKVLTARAGDRREQGEVKGKSVPEIKAGIKDELPMSVVALFDRRFVCSIDIAFVQETAVTRVELFEDAIYFAWYRGPGSGDVRFPETLCFKRDTFPYDVYTQEIHRRFEIADRRFRFDRDTAESYLLTCLQDLAGRSVSSDDLTEWRTKYATFAQPLERFLAGA